MLLSGTCRLSWKVGKEQERLCGLMLMLLNSRSVMKGSLRDLIEVSIGQTRGVPYSLALYSPAIHRAGWGKVVEDCFLVLPLRLTNGEGEFQISVLK